jgi:hypothetical protein
MILQEGSPSVSTVSVAMNRPKISRNASFRNDEAQLLQFSVDFGCTPIGIVNC